MKIFRFILALVLTVLILALGAGVFLGYRVSKLDTNYPNLSIDGTEVGGLTKEETVRAINDAGWEKRISTPLTVTTLGGQSFEVEPLRAGIACSAEEMADLAFSFGRDGGLIDRTVNYVKSLRSHSEIQEDTGTADHDYLVGLIEANEEAVNALLGEEEYTVDYDSAELHLVKGYGGLKLDREGLEEAIIAALQAGETELSFDRLAEEPAQPDFEAIFTELHKTPVNAEYSDDGRYEVIDEVIGCSFDTEDAASRWGSAAPAEEVVIPLELTVPEVTGEQLRSKLFGDLLGACTTLFPNSGDNRRNNLNLCCSKIDGMILYPGDVFSYNEVVGARTLEGGFLPAPAYVDGEEVDEVGGGACQVSSTLYAATLFAFMETVERECHIFPVHYMQLGTDATVTIPEGGRTVDFKFRNNREYPIKLVGIFNNDESSITFEIWGTLEDDDFMPVEFDNSKGWEFTYDRVIEPADPDRPGYKIKLEVDRYTDSDEQGERISTQTWRRVYDSEGNMVYEDSTNMLLPNGLHALDVYHEHNG